VANVSYLRPTVRPNRSALKAHRRPADTPGRRRGWFVAGGALILLVAAVGVAAVVFVSAKASLTADSAALATVGMPFGGGKIQSVTAVTGPHSRRVPVALRGQQIWPTKLIAAHQLVSIDVVIKRPSWISWLAGKTEHLRLTLMTPSASLREHYLTLRSGAPILLSFRQPVRMIAYGPPGQLVRRELATPRSEIRLGRTAEAGTISVAAAPRSWETAPPTLVSWFPAGAAAVAVANPAPGTPILPHTKITLTFSKPIASALGRNLPPVSPITPGTWHTISSHAMTFEPEGYGYGLGAHVNIALPNGVRLVGGQQSGTAATGNWAVPAGSTLRLQQMLSLLGYLPLKFNYAGTGVGLTPQAQETAAVQPPAGTFSWAYSNTPATLKSFWSPGSAGTVTRGALMAFETDQNLTADGVAGPAVWKALIAATIAGKRSAFGYTYVSVDMQSSPESLTLWHNGRTVLNTPVNTGISSAPTAPGTYPVYEHIASGTMSGTNPDGSHYSDAGIPWISYFNGGDALHGFIRGSYGSPQSLGCVEMPFSTAGQVYPYTPIGTLVHVA
jgi:hypothetical protein